MVYRPRMPSMVSYHRPRCSGSRADEPVEIGGPDAPPHRCTVFRWLSEVSQEATARAHKVDFSRSRAGGLAYTPNLGGWAPGTGCRPAYGPAPVDGTSRNIPGGIRTDTGVGKGLTPFPRRGIFVDVRALQTKPSPIPDGFSEANRGQTRWPRHDGRPTDLPAGRPSWQCPIAASSRL